MPANPDVGSSNDIWAVVGLVSTAIGTVIFGLLKGWSAGRDGMPQPKQIIMEQAELADLGDVTRLMRDIVPRLEQLYAIDTETRRTLDGNRERMDEVLKVLRRLDNDAEVAKRLREELLLNLRREPN